MGIEAVRGGLLDAFSLGGGSLGAMAGNRVEEGERLRAGATYAYRVTALNAIRDDLYRQALVAGLRVEDATISYGGAVSTSPQPNDRSKFMANILFRVDRPILASTAAGAIQSVAVGLGARLVQGSRGVYRDVVNDQGATAQDARTGPSATDTQTPASMANPTPPSDPNDAMRVVQARLNMKLPAANRVQESGRLDAATKRAVVALERRFGLSLDEGIPGKQVMRALDLTNPTPEAWAAAIRPLVGGAAYAPPNVETRDVPGAGGGDQPVVEASVGGGLPGWAKWVGIGLVAVGGLFALMGGRKRAA